MSFLKRYSLPLAAAMLLTTFFLSLPNLATVSLADEDGQRRKLCRADALIMAVITLVYGIVAFYGLGEREAPESFAYMEQKTAVITLPNERADSLMLYTGVGIGGYDIQYAADGVSYSPLTSYQQGSADVLKWQTVTLETPLYGGSMKIYGFGNVWLGEAVVLGEGQKPLKIVSTVAELADEQELLRTKQTFMNSTYFDEIYHARTAWEHMNRVEPYEITHPPLGKIIIALGMSVFGVNPFGWRFSGTLFGVLMLPIMYVFIKKMFGGKAVPAAGTILFASDFMHFVQTRISTIDTYPVFFTILMYLFMYLFISENRLRWLGLSGIFFGLGAASKWTGLYAGAGLALIWAGWVIISAKNGRLGIKEFIKNVCFCIVFFIIIPVFIYCLSYYPYAAARGGIKLFSGDYFKLVWANQTYMFNYHGGVTASHPYSSRWYQWLLDIRPILYYLEYMDDGMRSSFGAFVNPALCWGGLISLFPLGYLAIGRRDKKAAFIIVGYLAQLVPWIFIGRITFFYHYFACTVFLTLGMAYMFEIFRRGMKLWRGYVFAYAGISVVLFMLFYPVLSGRPVDTSYAKSMIQWFPSWPF